MFAEYRYTRVVADAMARRIGGEIAGRTGDTGNIRVDLNIRNRSAVSGVSFGSEKKGSRGIAAAP